ncbi:penicillin-binding protein 1A [Pseudomonadota bacterium]
MTLVKKLVRRTLISGVALGLLGAATAVGTYYYVAPQLPSVEVLKDVRFQVPLQVYTSEGMLIAEYGSKKRTPLEYEQIPESMINAILSAEDDRFFKHPGVDYQGILRAVFELVRTGKKSQGGSTITMQVARNFFLSREKTYMRKLNEIFLSFKIEQELSKEQILALYLNKIYLGNRAYGVGSASQIYYGKPIDELSLAQYAMVAGLPKAPSRYNPIANAERALIRRDYVLKRMHELGHISQSEYVQAKNEPVSAGIHQAAIDIQMPYIGEMVRNHMYDQFGEDAYTNGYNVYVTVNPRLQQAAQDALRRALLDYDRRHGYRGAIDSIEFNADTDVSDVLKQLKNISKVGNIKPALVYYLHEQSALALLTDGSVVTIPWEGLSWAAPYIDANQKGPAPGVAADILKPGEVIYVQQIDADNWYLAQVPEVAGAIVSLSPKDGSIQALTGGFDFFHTKFNRAVQAKRQPGSSFKPFVYSAALEKGFTTASIINDAPVVFDDSGLESSWRPENYSGRIYGPTRLREALIRSRNLVSIRLLQSIGINYTINYASQFGFDQERLPRDLSLSLGSAAVTPLELASAYTTFANSGFKLDPYFIKRIEDSKGEIIFEANPAIACLECEQERLALEKIGIDPHEQDSEDGVVDIGSGEAPAEKISPQPILAKRIIPQQNTYLVTSMMRDVIKRGTGRRALALKRKDLAGKTGTTNDQRDAWFTGFNADMVTISWTGFDDATPLGNKETGSRAALPMWIDYMKEALRDMPETPLVEPPGLITVRIDPKTGLLANTQQKDAIFETFRANHVPERRAPESDESIPTPNNNGDNGNTATQLLF